MTLQYPSLSIAGPTGPTGPAGNSDGHFVVDANDSVQHGITGPTTTETSLAAVTVQPILANGIIRITHLWSWTPSANVKTARIRLDGIAGTAFFNVSLTTNGFGRALTNILAVNSASVQKALSNGFFTGWGQTTGLTAGALDFSAALSLVFSGQLDAAASAAAETIALESYTIEVLRRA